MGAEYLFSMKITIHFQIFPVAPTNKLKTFEGLRVVEWVILYLFEHTCQDF
jgi:hypothetical protein